MNYNHYKFSNFVMGTNTYDSPRTLAMYDALIVRITSLKEQQDTLNSTFPYEGNGNCLWHSMRATYYNLLLTEISIRNDLGKFFDFDAGDRGAAGLPPLEGVTPAYLNKEETMYRELELTGGHVLDFGQLEPETDWQLN